MNRRDDLTDVPGFRVGSAENADACTGCTVILCPPEGAVGGVDQRGGAPGTRETDPMRPLHLVDRCHAVLLAGGSAFGLDAAGGVVRYLERAGIGFPTVAARVPIVPAAVIYDLGVGRADVRPDAAMGETACAEAERGDVVRQGNAGAGFGATVGKVHGIEGAMKGGLGSASVEAANGVVVGAVVVVNAFGDVCDPASGRILAGARRPGKQAPATQGAGSRTADPQASGPPTPATQAPDSLIDPGAFADTVEVMRQRGGRPLGFAPASTNTLLAVVATNARMGKEGANVLAQMAAAGFARAVRPVHTQVDGDTIFALASGERECDVSLVGALAADIVATATVRAIHRAKALAGIPCADDVRGRAAGIRVREGNAADADAIETIARGLPEWFTPNAFDEMRRDAAQHKTLIAEIDEEPLGFLIHGPSAHHPETDLTEIRWLGVARRTRGRGIGHALLRVLEDDLRARGGGTLELLTLADTEFYPPYEETRTFYRACGWTEFYTDATERKRRGIEILYFRKRIEGGKGV